MATKAKNLVPAMATHPGEILKDLLLSRNISQTDFANDIGILLPHLNDVIKGKRNVTAEFALLLEKALKDISAVDWLKYQSAYELDLTRIKEKVRDKLALLERWNTIKDNIPYKFFKKQNLITDNLEENERVIKEIYSATTIEDIIQTVSDPDYAHFKKSSAFTESRINVAGWVKFVKYQAKKKVVNKFSLKRKDELIDELKRISLQKNLQQKTEKLLKEFGIKFIVQDKPDKAPIDGVSFWVDDNPTIGVTLRYHRIDNFIFTIMHELGHIYLHLSNHRDRKFIDDMEDHKYMSENTFEKEANSFASENLITSDDWENFTLKYFTIDERAITDFAAELKIHPAIVKGRLCHEQPHYYRKRFSIPNELC